MYALLSLLPLLPVIHCKERRAGGRAGSLQRWVFLLFAHLINTCWWVLNTRSFSVELRLGRTSVWSFSLGGKKKERGICNQNFTAGIETKLQNHHPFFKVFPHRSTKTRMPKKLAVEKIKWQTPKKNSLPKITSTKHPQHRQTHPKPQKRKGGEKKKNRQRTKHTQQTSYCFSLENCSSNPNPREKKKQQPKTSRKTHSN